MNQIKLIHRLQSFKYAMSGAGLLIKSQHNAWIHLTAAIAVITLGLFLSLSATEWCLITIAISAVFTAEAMNTALEFLANAFHPTPHPLVGKAKDLAAASVLFASIGAAVIGGIVFLPKLMGLFA